MLGPETELPSNKFELRNQLICIHAFCFISMGNLQIYLSHCLFFSNLIQFHAQPMLIYFFLKSNIAMLIFGIKKSTAFHNFKEKSFCFMFKNKNQSKTLKLIKKHTNLKRFFRLTRYFRHIFRENLTSPCLVFGEIYPSQAYFFPNIFQPCAQSMLIFSQNLSQPC